MARMLLDRLMALPNDSATKTVAVALGVCLAGSLLVASAAVLLQPLQQANQERERQKHILEMVESLRSSLEAGGEAGELDVETPRPTTSGRRQAIPRKASRSRPIATSRASRGERASRRFTSPCRTGSLGWLSFPFMARASPRRSMAIWA